MEKSAADSSRQLFGNLPDGRPVYSYVLRNSNNFEMTVIEFGGIITKLITPAKKGRTDIVLGFDTIEDYLDSRNLPASPHFGAIIGRYSGRIKEGKFAIDGKQFQLNPNNNGNTLHGGNVGFDKILWTVKNVSWNEITLTYSSPDGDENFPGELTVEVTYSLSETNEITITYSATSTEDTIINLTQHSYFNLDGQLGSVLNQELHINSDTILEIDAVKIPSGKLEKAADKGFDFRTPRACPPLIDDSFVIEDTSAPAAILISSSGGLRMTVYSDQPSLHIYIGGNLFGTLKGKDGTNYHPFSGICFESQNYPDAPNHAHFPNAILRKGEQYQQITKWKFDFPE
ncbi:MAG TPA: aldose epimerase family protein [Flavobacterium sp.]|jgi:aldose 1-epimerase